MTPIKQVEELKTDFLDQIMSIFERDIEIFSVEFETEPNDLNIDPLYLSRDGVLTCLDEFGNDYDVKLSAMSIEVVAYILTVIQNKKFDVYEKI
jgi:hypothetical protein